MTPDELSQRLAMLGSRRRTRTPTDWVPVAFSICVGGVGGVVGILGGAAAYLALGGYHLDWVRVAVVGLIIGFVPGIVSALIFNGRMILLSFLFGALAGFIFPFGIIILRESLSGRA